MKVYPHPRRPGSSPVRMRAACCLVHRFCERRILFQTRSGRAGDMRGWKARGRREHVVGNVEGSRVAMLGHLSEKAKATSERLVHRRQGSGWNSILDPVHISHLNRVN